MKNVDLDKYLKEADKKMKETNGHSYMTTLKTRCIYCNRSQNQKGKCSNWFQTFIDRFREILINNGEVKL